MIGSEAIDVALSPLLAGVFWIAATAALVAYIAYTWKDDR